MNKLSRAVNLTNLAAEQIANDKTGFNLNAGDLVARNFAVLMGRLSFEEFNNLSSDTQLDILDAANMARGLAKIPKEDLKKYRDESEDEFKFRMMIRQPLHNYQRLLNTGMKETDPAKNKLHRRASKLFSIAFEATARETNHLPLVSETAGYFEKNSEAALRNLGVAAIDMCRPNLN